MSTYESASAVNLPAGEDLNGDLYEILKVDSNGRVVKATAATDVVVGVLSEDPGRTTVAGTDSVPVVPIGRGGIVLMKAAGAVSAGEIAVPSTTAGSITSVADPGALAVDQMGVGVILEAATAAGDVIRVLSQVIATPHTA